mmetsp:Transcript_33084/g.77401  ORF Transcript_33084/g.77401 Transcript_33084/m.77401 type:complete len:366 (-) Transcript_33084:151-1248(-)
MPPNRHVQQAWRDGWHWSGGAWRDWNSGRRWRPVGEKHETSNQSYHESEPWHYKGKDWDTGGKKGKDKGKGKGKGKKKGGKGADPGAYSTNGLVSTTVLGEGAGGICFKGTMQMPDGGCVPVAIKPVSHACEQDILTKLQALAPSLRNVAPVLEVAKDTPGGQVNVMKLASEGSLADIVHQIAWAGDYLSRTEFLEVIAQVAAGLCGLHKAGVLHCDVKPDNVVLHRDADKDTVELWLLDFGDARLADDWTWWEWLGPGDPSIHCRPDMETGYYSEATDAWSLAQFAAMLWAGQAWEIQNPAWLDKDMPLFQDFLQCLSWDSGARPTVQHIAAKARAELQVVAPSNMSEDTLKALLERAAAMIQK